MPNDMGVTNLLPVLYDIRVHHQPCPYQSPHLRVDIMRCRGVGLPEFSVRDFTRELLTLADEVEVD